MGQGGFITLVNGTPYDWTNIHQHSYQMNSWGFPTTIPAWKTAQVYVEWDQNAFDSQSDDAGEVVYSLNGTPFTFQVQARNTNGFDLQVYFTNLATSGNPQGSTLSLGWSHDGSVAFVLAGESGNFTANVVPAGWMQHNLGQLGGRTLRQLCIPGSHDSGMSVVNGRTAFAFPCSVITQTTSILGQLTLGARYFDIRPVISGGQYFTGHYSDITQINSWQGANGESIAQVINDVNSFTAVNKELVILYLSHDYNTDVGNSSYRAFTQQEYNGLLAQLGGLNNLYAVANPGDLTQIQLNDYIGQNKAAVIVVVDAPGITVGDAYFGKGFYLPANFPVYNQYSDTNDAAQMVSGQLGKMKEQRTSPTSSYFLLSWTLTQDGTQATTCEMGAASILDLAAEADPLIYQDLLPACSPQTYPNILYIDNINSGAITALAMAVNTLAING